MKQRTLKVTRSSGNVFLDLGFSRQEAENLRVRAELMAEMRRIIRSRRLTQTAAGSLFGVTQPRISDLTRGRIKHFSIEDLVTKHSHARMKVVLNVRPAA